MSFSPATTAHLLSAALWFGMLVWVSFVGGMVMFRNMSRQAFGAIQSKLFPWYFRIGVFCHVILLLTLSRKAYFDNFVALCVSLACTATNLLVVGPWTSRLGSARHRFEKEEGNNSAPSAEQLAAEKQFKIAHGTSSMLNLVSIIVAVFHLVTLSNSLQLSA